MSVDLFIVRHGIAHDPDPSEWPDDDARPLTQSGIDRFEKAARGLGKISGKVDLLFTSSLVRAVQTAEILTDKADWPQAEELKQLRPETAPITLLEALRDTAGDNSSVGIVGHEPQLSGLIEALCGARVNLKKGGVARVDAVVLTGGGGTLRWLVTQKILRSAKH